MISSPIEDKEEDDGCEEISTHESVKVSRMYFSLLLRALWTDRHSSGVAQQKKRGVGDYSASSGWRHRRGTVSP